MTSSSSKPVTVADDDAVDDPQTNTAWAAALFTADSGASPRPLPNAATAATHDEPAAPGTDFSEDTATPHSPPPDLSLLATAASAPAKPPADPAGTPASKRWAQAFIAAGVIISAITIPAMLLTGPPPPPAPKHADNNTLPAGPPPSSPPPSAQPAGQILIPYTATTYDPLTHSNGGCYEGSTSAAAIEQAASDAVFVCVRGPGGAGGGADGQIVHFTLGDASTGQRYYKLEEIDITAGWVPKVPGAKDEWSEHRVPTLVRCVFTDPNGDPQRPPTVWDIDTHNQRGPVPYRGAQPVLTSEFFCLIRKTSRPPKEAGPQPSSTLAPEESAVPSADEPTETPPPDSTTPDPVDATFAMSLVQLKGTLP